MVRKASCAIVLTLMLLLLAFSSCAGAPSVINEPSSTNAPLPVVDAYTPRFLDIAAGKLAIKNLMFGSDGWRLWHRENYLFATFGAFVLRYDIAENQIDRIVFLGERQEGYIYCSSLSSSGDCCIAYSVSFQTQLEEYRNFFRIDFEAEQITFISEANEENLLFEPLESETADARQRIALIARELAAFEGLRLGEGGAAEVLALNTAQLGAIMPSDNQKMQSEIEW